MKHSIFIVVVLCFCSVCNAGETYVPSDLIDVEKIQGLTLTDLEWNEQSRQQVGNVVVIGGSWTGPHFSGSTSNLEGAEIDLTEYATIYLPVDQPAEAEIHQLVYAVHVEGNAKETVPEVVELSEKLPVACIFHGQKSQDWTSLGFESRDEMIAMTFLILQLLNPCEPKDYKLANFGVSLAETQMMALTLLSRVLEAEGYTPGRAAMQGLSKEGFSTWFASAVDDRIVAAAPGGFPLEDWISATEVEEANWGCEGTGAGGASLPDLIQMRKWYSETQSGNTALKYFSVSEFVDELKPEFFLIHGDVGMYNMHDGIYFSPGADTSFLENFNTHPFRFDRVPDRGERESYLQWNIRLLTLLSHYMITNDISSYPEIERSHVETEAKRFKAFAQVNPRPDTVRLWWSYSDDRPFDDPGNAPWRSVEMTLEGDSWVSPWVTIPEAMMIGWYVEGENTLVWEQLDLVQRDTSPQRFFHEFPPLTCPDIPGPDCSYDLRFKRGDANTDGTLNIADAVFTLIYLFDEGDEPFCSDAADANDDSTINIADAIYLLTYLFSDGPDPLTPFPNCGIDTTSDELGCEEYDPCS